MVRRPSHRVAAALTAAALAFIAFMTLRPVDSGVALPAWCIVCGPLGGVDFSLNTVLFVPFGLGLMWMTGQWRRSALIGAITTLCIESFQWRLIPGRDASLGDILANSMGTVIGAWLAVAGLCWLNASRMNARKLAAVASLLTIGAVYVSAWLLLPPRPATNSGCSGRRGAAHSTCSRPPARGFFEWNRNPTRRDTRRATNVGYGYSRPVSSRQGERTGALDATPGDCGRIANEREEGFALAQWREAVVFRTHLVAARLKLRPLLARLDRAFSSSATGTNGESSSLHHRSCEQSACHSDQKRILTWQGRRWSPSVEQLDSLWALFLPWDIALGPSWWPVNAGWLAVLILPVSFFQRPGCSKAG
jgi:hypothetical protein